MENTNDPQILGEIVKKFLEEGKTIFTKEELEEEYNKVLEQIRIEKKRKEAIKIYSIKKEEIKYKLNSTIATNRIRTKDIYEIQEEYNQIIEDNQTEAIEKNEKLDVIEQKIDSYNENVEAIYTELKNIKEKIQLTRNSRYNNEIRSIYDASIELNNLEEELPLTIFNSTIEEIKESLNNISKKLEGIQRTIDKIYNLYTNKSLYYNGPGKKYKLSEIIIIIDSKNKKYQIEYEENFLEKLKDTAIKRLKKLLKEKINYGNINEIIEPKYVNEQKLSLLINKKIIQIQDLMKFNIIGLLRHLSLDKAVEEISPEDLAIENDDFRKMYDIMQILNNVGYEQENQNTFEEKLKKDYKDIYIEPETIYKIVMETIIECCPNEPYVYSSMQNAYNCIDRETMNEIHQFFRGKKPELSDEVTKAVEFIKRYSRNSKGETYTSKEILNFLKQKSEIVYPTEREITEEFPTFNSDINEEMYQVTGVKKNYSPSTLDDTKNLVISKLNISRRGRKKI